MRHVIGLKMFHLSNEDLSKCSRQYLANCLHRLKVVDDNLEVMEDAFYFSRLVSKSKQNCKLIPKKKSAQPHSRIRQPGYSADSSGPHYQHTIRRV